jgi:hypothetical protein
VLSETLTNRSELTPPTPSRPSSGTIPLLLPTPCNVVCALKDLKRITFK